MQIDFSYPEDEIRAQAKADGITHISTGVAVVKDGKILMTRRAAADFLGGSYELPGGGVDAGETILQGAIREVKEETGLTVTRVIATFPGFDYTTDRKPKVRQINFAVEVAPGDIQLDPDEHDDYKWVEASASPDLTMSENMRTCVSNAFKALSSARSS